MFTLILKMSFNNNIKIYILLVIVLMSRVRTKKTDKNCKKEKFHFPPLPQGPPRRDNRGYPLNDEVPEYIRDQFARNKFSQDNRNHNFRPEAHPFEAPFVPPRFARENEIKRQQIELIIFGASMFVLGILVVVLLYLIVYYYNKWLRRKERLFYKKLRYLIPKTTPQNVDFNNNDNNVINNIDDNIVPNASHDLNSELSSDFEGINRKMYTNVIL